MAFAFPQSRVPETAAWEWKRRSWAAVLHFLLTGTLLLTVLVLFVSRWYPESYRQLSGGWSLLLIVLSVDLCLGPLLTWAVFDVRKSRSGLWRDLSAVGLLQTAALLYGVSVVAESRPVALVFAVDRFTLVAAGDLRMQELPFSPPDVHPVSWRGPALFSTRESRPAEVLDSVSLASQGYDLAQRPTYWQPYEPYKSKALSRARSIEVLWAKHGLTRDTFCRRFPSTSCPDELTRFLPLEAKSGEGAVLLDGNGDVQGAVSLSGFD